MNKLIVLLGQAGAGKSTVAATLQRMLDHSNCYAFAEPIKEMADVLIRHSTNFTGGTISYNEGLDYDSNETKKLNTSIGGVELTIRKLLQTLGTEWGRSVDKDLWVKCMDQKYKATTDKYFIITDARFPNEIAWSQDNGATIINVVGRGDLVSEHESEGYFGILADTADYTLDNSKDLNHLHKQINTVLQEIK